MSRASQTKSEALFLEYCKLRGYTAQKISDPRDDDRFADYETRVASDRVIVEIKELHANPNDEQLGKALKKGLAGTFGDVPGRRVRTHIEDAERQLRRYEAEQLPCVLVLYDNILVNGCRVHPYGLWLEPYHIDVGMYGLQYANARIHQDGRTEWLGDTRGKQRTLRDTKRTNVSAVAVLYDHTPDNGLFLIVYHNFYARVPLSKSLFSHPKDRQMEKPDPEASPGPWVLVRN